MEGEYLAFTAEDVVLGGSLGNDGSEDMLTVELDS